MTNIEPKSDQAVAANSAIAANSEFAQANVQNRTENPQRGSNESIDEYSQRLYRILDQSKRLELHGGALIIEKRANTGSDGFYVAISGGRETPLSTDYDDRHLTQIIDIVVDQGSGTVGIMGRHWVGDSVGLLTVLQFNYNDASHSYELKKEAHKESTKRGRYGAMILDASLGIAFDKVSGNIVCADGKKIFSKSSDQSEAISRRLDGYY